MQYKNMLVSKRLIAKLIAAHQAGTVSVHRDSPGAYIEKSNISSKGCALHTVIFSPLQKQNAPGNGPLNSCLNAMDVIRC